MNKFMRHSALMSLLLCGSSVTANVPSHLTPINPITVTLENGPISLNAGTPGTASYLVSVDAGVTPYSPLTMYITPSQPWATVSQATSTCTTPTQTCTSPISLLPGQKCCLMLNLDGTQLTAGGQYALAPSVATNPPGFGGNAASQPVTVTAAPAGFTVTIEEGTNGTVTPLGAQTVAPNGNTSLLTAISAGGYIVDYWLYTGTTTSSYQGGGLTSTYYGVTEDATIKAFFVSYTASITVPAAPTDFTALNNAASTEVALSWGVPDNRGAAITGYQVTPYIGATPQSPTIFTGTSGTITGLSPTVKYTFAIQATNDNANYGPAAYSSAVTPNASIVASTAALALSINDPSNPNLTGHARTITFYNDSGASVTLESTAVTFSGLPNGTNTSTTCNNNAPLSAGASCTVTVTPGNTATSDCMTGTPPIAGTVTLHTTVPSISSADVYVFMF